MADGGKRSTVFGSDPKTTRCGSLSVAELWNLPVREEQHGPPHLTTTPLPPAARRKRRSRNVLWSWARQSGLSVWIWGKRRHRCDLIWPLAPTSQPLFVSVRPINHKRPSEITEELDLLSKIFDQPTHNQLVSKSRSINQSIENFLK